MDKQQAADLEFILRDLESLGLISWIPEGKAGQMAYHVVPDPFPPNIEFFESIYQDAQARMR
jgi:hypothetical protein